MLFSLWQRDGDDFADAVARYREHRHQPTTCACVLMGSEAVNTSMFLSSGKRVVKVRRGCFHIAGIQQRVGAGLRAVPAVRCFYMDGDDKRIARVVQAHAGVGHIILP